MHLHRTTMQMHSLMHGFTSHQISRIEHIRPVTRNRMMRIATNKVINRRKTMSKQRFEVQRHLDQIYVARQSGELPHPQPGEVTLQMVACGICGADIRVATGNKTASGAPGRYTTLGHEGIGRVVALGSSSTELQLGDYV